MNDGVVRFLVQREHVRQVASGLRYTTARRDVFAVFQDGHLRTQPVALQGHLIPVTVDRKADLQVHGLFRVQHPRVLRGTTGRAVEEQHRYELEEGTFARSVTGILRLKLRPVFACDQDNTLIGKTIGHLFEQQTVTGTDVLQVKHGLSLRQNTGCNFFRVQDRDHRHVGAFGRQDETGTTHHQVQRT